MSTHGELSSLIWVGLNDRGATLALARGARLVSLAVKVLHTDHGSVTIQL